MNINVLKDCNYIIFFYNNSIYERIVVNGKEEVFRLDDKVINSLDAIDYYVRYELSDEEKEIFKGNCHDK